MASGVGILDTGTTLILIATGRLLATLDQICAQANDTRADAFNLYKYATGAVLDATTGLPRITSAQFGNLKLLFFIIGGRAFEFTPNAQIWPCSLNSLIGGTATGIYLVVNDIGSPSGQGLDVINSLALLERFYTVYDTTNKQIGADTTQFTTATAN